MAMCFCGCERAYAGFRERAKGRVNSTAIAIRDRLPELRELHEVLTASVDSMVEKVGGNRDAFDEDAPLFLAVEKCEALIRYGEATLSDVRDFLHAADKHQAPAINERRLNSHATKAARFVELCRPLAALSAADAVTNPFATATIAMSIKSELKRDPEPF